MTALTRELAQKLIDQQGTWIKIPNIYTSINDGAFSTNPWSSNALWHVEIPQSITSIGSEAFSGNKLRSVVIPDSVTTIGNKAFNNNSLTSAEIGGGAKSIGNHAFQGNNLQSVKIGKNVKSIGDYAFSFDSWNGWNQLRTLDIPDSVETIGDYAFQRNNLTSINFGKGVKSIGNYAFYVNGGLDSISLPDSVTSIGDYAFFHNKITNVVIPDNVTSLGERPFYNWTGKLQSISVSKDSNFDLSYYENSGTEITRRGANRSPTDLVISSHSLNENISSESTVATLSSTDPDDGDTFTYSLVEGVGSTDNDAFTIVGDQIKIKSSPDYETQDSYSVRLRTEDSGGLTFEKSFTFNVNDLNEDPTNLLVTESNFDEHIIPGSVVAILSSTDPDSDNTHTYTLISGSGDTDNSAFTVNGNQLKINASPDYEIQDSYSVRLQTKDSTGLIFDKAFTFSVNDVEEYEDLTRALAQNLIDEQGVDIIIPDFVTSIVGSGHGNTQEAAFAYQQLTSVDMGDGITSIGDFAFYKSELKSVEIPDNVTSIGQFAFYDNQLKRIDIGSSITSIEPFTFYGNQLTSVHIPDGVTSIGPQAFGFNQLTSVHIPDGVTSLAGFYGNQLTSVRIPNGVTSLGGFGSNQLTSIEIPDSVVLIDDGAFQDNQLSSIVIPKAVTSIGKQAFKDNQLTSIEIPDNVTSIGDYAFFRNDLVSVDIGSGVISIGDAAFMHNQLINIEIPNSATSIGEFAFLNNQLTSIEIPDSVTLIGQFAYCGNQLTSIEIGDGITSIADAAFASNQLTNIEIPGNISRIGSYAFQNNQLKSVYIGDGVTSIGQFAFENNQLTGIHIPDSVILIEPGAFRSNPLLESISISENATFDLSIFPEGVEIIRRSDNTSPLDIDISVHSFNENIAAASTVSILSSTDPDAGDSFTYSLVSGTGDTDNSTFTIAGDQLKIIDSPDFENKSSYSIRIRTTDLGGLSFEKAFTLVVKNIYEIPDNIINSSPGKGKLWGTRKADQFTFNQFEPFNKNTADRIIRFKPSQGDTIAISAAACPSLLGADEITFATARTAKEVKRLSRQDINFVYFQNRGRLFFNGNGATKGWGEPDEGGLFAFMHKRPELSADDFTLLA